MGIAALVGSYRRFGTNYAYHLQKSSSQISRHVSVNTAWNIVRFCVDMCSAQTKSDKSKILGPLVRKVFHKTFRLTNVFRLPRQNIF